MVQTYIHPLDPSRLKKGMWLETNELEAATGVSREDSDQWRLAVLKLREWIELTTGILCKLDRNRLRLMADIEASRYTLVRTHQHARGMLRQAANQTLIDHTTMDGDQQREAESTARIVTSTALAANKTLRKQKELAAITAPRGLSED